MAAQVFTDFMHHVRCKEYEHALFWCDGMLFIVLMNDQVTGVLGNRNIINR